MKKIIDFITENIFVILMAIFILAVAGCFLLPLFIYIARYFWEMALSTPLI